MNHRSVSASCNQLNASCCLSRAEYGTALFFHDLVLCPAHKPATIVAQISLASFS